jgi:hypothetical protein
MVGAGEPSRHDSARHEVTDLARLMDVGKVTLAASSTGPEASGYAARRPTRRIGAETGRPDAGWRALLTEIQ